MSESAAQALSILRDPTHFQWYIIPLLVIVIYMYNVEIGKQNWNVVFAGVALWGMDWFNEIWNALVFHFTQYAPVWAAPGDTAYLILVGLNIEISLMFLMAGVGAAQVLPSDKSLKIWGIPNRFFIACVFSLIGVVVEVALNGVNALTWDYWWWSQTNPWLIFLIGYLPFFVVAFWVHDMPTIKKKVTTIGAIYAFDITCLIIFGGILGWI